MSAATVNTKQMFDRASRPPGVRHPVWAMKEFRWLIGGAFVALSIVGVFIFEIAPVLRSRGLKSSAPEKVGRNPYSPGTLPKDEVRFDGLLSSVKDGTGIDDYGPAFVRLMKHVRSVDQAVLSKGSLGVAFEQYAKNADELRGRTVRVNEMLVQDWPIKVDELGSDDLENHVHKMMLVDQWGKSGYVVYTAEPPPAMGYRPLVTVDGVFLKMASYESSKSGVMITAPVIIAKRVVPAPESHSVDSVLGSWVVGISVASVALIGLLSFRVWSRNRRERDRLIPFPK